jgi:hypothetical protein
MKPRQMNDGVRSGPVGWRRRRRTSGVTTFEGQVKTKAGKKVTMELDAAGKPVKK